LPHLSIGPICSVSLVISGCDRRLFRASVTAHNDILRAPQNCEFGLARKLPKIDDRKWICIELILDDQVFFIPRGIL
jgi:hypothetical protein